jgi:LAS superfamily LD-carboxypeptidase LdcB
VSGWRSVEEQAQLYAQLGPDIAAPPGQSLHHAATELDLSVGAAGSPTHRWLSSNAGHFHFIQRYSWEPWHWGNTRGC